MHDWSDFYVATAGAAAALAGLLFVGVSINISRVLEYPSLPTRASISLILLMAILSFSVLLLIPSENIKITGWIVSALAVILSIVIIKSNIKMYKQTDKEYRKFVLRNLCYDQLATLPYLVAGILLLLGNEAGLYWIAAAFLISYIKAISDAWVLLVEILR